MNGDSIPPTDAVRVRTVVAADADALRTLRLEALRLHPVALTTDLAETEARPPDYWRELIDRSGGDGGEVTVVADAGARGLAGMAGVFTSKQPKLAHAGTVWGVYVRENFRGAGVGEALVSACVRWARERGLITLKLWVMVGNESAIRCYERCGFVRSGIEPLAVRWEGRFYDEALMVLRL